MLKKTLLPTLLIILLAVGLRTYRLTELPPGLTHDEANHGREAIGILDGTFLFYFPLNYGSEPLYSYTVAGSMLLFGENLFALRLVNVVFGLGAMGLAFLWTARIFDRRTALLALALTAVSFWPLASSREALRAGMLPFFMVGAVWFFWKILESDEYSRPRPMIKAWGPVIGFAIFVAATLHIYLASRVAWLVFPLFAMYLAMLHRHTFRRTWLSILIGLALAGLMAVPMFVYVRNHPEVLTRLDMLDGPLQELRNGNFTALFQNIPEALLAFVLPGYGDKFLAYNIPGRPVFDAISAIFFVAGLITSLWRWKQPKYAFLLLWFVTSIIPSLITGATANTTRNMAALSVTHLLPVIGFLAATDLVTARFNHRFTRLAIAVSATVWISLTGYMTAQDYFVHWGQSPEVRGAYQHTLVEALKYLERETDFSPTVISTIYPGPAHDPSIGLVMLPQSNNDTRWVDARFALVYPNGQDGQIILPASTPPHPAFAELLHAVDSVSLRPDDLDPGFTLYDLDATLLEQWASDNVVDFDGAVSLLYSQWMPSVVRPGETAELLTLWKVIDPTRVGPIVPPMYTTDVVLFTQVLDNTGHVLSQRDSLEAPSWDWQSGDIVIQVHPVAIPEETAPGSYETIVGIYDQVSKDRRPVTNEDGEILDTRAFVAPLQVEN